MSAIMHEVNKPDYLPVEPSNIPEELQAISQWVCWKAVWVDGDDNKPGRWAKVPFHPNGFKVSVTTPGQWSEFSDVVAAYERSGGIFDGIGFVLTVDDPYTAIDLDKCIDTEGDCEKAVEGIIKHMNSYTEFSPSGTGIRIFIKGALPPGSRNRKGKIEVYNQGRYVTVTGQIIEGVE